MNRKFPQRGWVRKTFNISNRIAQNFTKNMESRPCLNGATDSSVLNKNLHERVIHISLSTKRFSYIHYALGWARETTLRYWTTVFFFFLSSDMKITKISWEYINLKTEYTSPLEITNNLHFWIFYISQSSSIIIHFRKTKPKSLWLSSLASWSYGKYWLPFYRKQQHILKYYKPLLTSGLH